MNTANEIQAASPSRRSFLRNASFAIGGLATVASAEQREKEEEHEHESMRAEHDHLKKGDRDILVAAEIAEALAVTTYSNIITNSPFFKQLPYYDHASLIASLQPEFSPYLPHNSLTDP